jgi:hypothetical protein
LGILQSAAQWDANACNILHAANAASCMTPMLIAANAACCMPHALVLFFMKQPKLLHACCASKVFEFS